MALGGKQAQVFGTYGQKSKRQFYETMYSGLLRQRANFEPAWLELAKYMQPERIRLVASERNRGHRGQRGIYDSTATFSGRVLESGLHAGLTSPARPWFNLSTPDPDLAAFGPVKAWLYDVTQRMRAVFAQTNLYNALPTVYGDLGTFATGCMGIVPDTRDLFRADDYPVGSYVVARDHRGRPAVFMREYQMTVFELVEMFGGEDGQPAVPGRPIHWDRISLACQAAWDQGQYDAEVTILWVVAPNREYRPDSLLQGMPFTSCHYERGMTTNRGDIGADDKLKTLRESGFESFPVMVPRWAVTDKDAYGTNSPGLGALPDTKQLQDMQKRKGHAIAKIVDPPLVGPSALMNQKTSLLSGDITYVDELDGTKGLRAIHEVNIRLDELLLDVQATQFRIKTAFYEPLFLMLSQSDGFRGNQPPTAREIEERHEEKLLALGPVLERTNDELLDPLIDRVFSMMQSAGMLPEPPEELDSVNLRVEYVSIMAQAQKLVGVAGADRFLQTMVPLSEVAPIVRHKIKFGPLVDGYANMLGIDPSVLATDEEAEESLQGEQRAQQQVMQAEAMQRTAQAAQAASQTPLAGGGTALDALQGALTGT